MQVIKLLVIRHTNISNILDKDCLQEFVRDYSSLTNDNHDQVGFGGRGLVGGGGTFHGCVIDPRLMMIPKEIYFGL